MKEHQLCLKHLETKGPTTHVAFVGAVAAAVHGCVVSPAAVDDSLTP